MFERRIDALLNGEPPSLKDFWNFVGLAEKLSTGALWQALHEFPKLHPILRNVIHKNLQERIPRESMDADLDKVAQEMQRRFATAAKDPSSSKRR